MMPPGDPESTVPDTSSTRAVKWRSCILMTDSRVLLTKLRIFSYSGGEGRAVQRIQRLPCAGRNTCGSGAVPLAAFSPTSRKVINNSFNAPYDLAIDASGNLYIANSHSNTVVKETYSAGAFTGSVIANVDGPEFSRGVAVDGAGSVLISDEHNEAIYLLPWNPGRASRTAEAQTTPMHRPPLLQPGPS